MKKVALTILVMGVSIALVIVVWIGIGDDPNFSAEQMQEQQASLREEYGLSQQETLTAEQLETPPSLLGLESSAGNETSVASNATGGDQTVAGKPTSANQTAACNATAGNQTSAGNGTAASPVSGSVIKVSIVSGASGKTDDAYNPNPVQAKPGNTVTWTNSDSTPHMATSGANSKPDGTFDSGTLKRGKSFGFMFEKAGEYPYFCTLHPNMAGTVNVC
ncbi:MAG TPA: plastocyanin/azurin family copper-binding protein [Nitrososphaera sp.]|nr:plastocyanin/azurin family copper-binding protein [Nitrososphaera sp.]